MEPRANDGLQRKLNAQLLEQSKAELESNAKGQGPAMFHQDGRQLHSNMDITC